MNQVGCHATVLYPQMDGLPAMVAAIEEYADAGQGFGKEIHNAQDKQFYLPWQ